MTKRSPAPDVAGPVRFNAITQRSPTRKARGGKERSVVDTGPEDLGIEYMTSVGGVDSPWTAGPVLLGERSRLKPDTKGIPPGIDAFALRLTGPLAARYSIRYWGAFGSKEIGPFADGALCGTRGQQFPLGGIKVMINVGSVGQPRDGDPRACYVILEDGYPEGGSSEPGESSRPGD